MEVISKGSAIKTMTESLESALDDLEALDGVLLVECRNSDDFFPLDLSKARENLEKVQGVLDQFRGTSQFFPC